MQFSHSSFRVCSLIVIVGSMLTACGGGGGGGSSVPADTTPPTASSVSPADGSVDVATNVVVRTTLSEAIAPASVSQTTLTLSDGVANVPGTVTVSGSTVSLTPDAALDESTAFTATLNTTVTDLAGNNLQNPVVWGFTTGDFTPPSVSSTSPDNGDLDVSVDELTVAFMSENLDPATVTVSSMTLSTGGSDVSGSAALDGSSQAVVFTPDQLLNTLTDYQANLLGSVADLAGNTLAATETWNFRTSLKGTLSTVYASAEATTVVRRVDTYEDQIVGQSLLSDAAWTGLEANSIGLSSDGSAIAYRADENVADVMVQDELFVVPMTGGTPVKVSGLMTNGGSVWEFAWSPNASQLAYVADKDTDGVNELYVVNADGTGERKLTTGLNLDERFVEWSPAGDFIAVASGDSENPDFALYVVPAAGGGLVGISGTKTVELDDDVRPRWSPDGAYIAYATPNTLYVNDTTGAAEFEMSPGTATDVNQFKWMSDSSRIVWRGLDSPGVIPQRLFVATVGVGSGSALSNVESFEFAIAPDDSLIAFIRADGATNALYVIAPDGLGETRISLTPATAQRVRSSDVPVWAPDASAVLYAERETSLTSYELHLATPDAATNITLSNIQATSGELEDYSFSPEGSRVAYGAFLSGQPEGIIYQVELDGSGRIELTDTAGGEDAASFALRDDDGITELFGLAFGI